MFLIKLAFWLALLVLILPTDPAKQERLAAVASQTMHRVATFCERNGSVCARSGEYWAMFKQKVEFGARLAFDMASERVSGKSDAPEATGSITPPAPIRAERGRGGAAEPAADVRAKPAKGGA